MIKAIDARRGMAVNFKGGLWVIVDNNKVAKGNWRSYQVISLKNIQTGQLIEDRFRTDEPFDQAMLDRKPMEYLYSDSSGHIVMDNQTYEQVTLSQELVGDQKVFLQPNIQIQVAFVDGKPITIELPNTVELKVVDTPPGIRGATATNQTKEAVCEGEPVRRIKVPPFVENGQVVRVDTRTGEYLGKVQ